MCSHRCACRAGGAPPAHRAHIHSHLGTEVPGVTPGPCRQPCPQQSMGRGAGTPILLSQGPEGIGRSEGADQAASKAPPSKAEAPGKGDPTEAGQAGPQGSPESQSPLHPQTPGLVCGPLKTSLGFVSAAVK